MATRSQVVPTTSRLSRRSKSKEAEDESSSRLAPLKSITLEVTLKGQSEGFKRLASQNGLDFSENRDELMLTITAATPEEALAKLRVLASAMASKQ